VYPELFSIGPIKFYSFGAMLALAFLAANYLMAKEVARKKLPDVTNTVLALSIILGLVGAKLFDVLEHLDDLARDPLGTLFSSGGLAYYGGLILALIGNYIYLKWRKVPILPFLDAAAPAIMLAYGIGRIGCLLAGDGCYGQPTDLPWAMTYPNGIVSTLADRNPRLVHEFKRLFPNQPVPADIAVHPTPIYESLYAFIFFVVLWRMRLQARPHGQLFFLFLALQAVSRFLVEFVRLNDMVAFGLTQAQLISIVLLIVALVGWQRVSAQPIAAEPAAPATPTKKKKSPKKQLYST
jgi:phosphatidylglycerol:prolipoprotein diacylglycerol transferase